LELLIGGRVRSDGIAVGVPSYIERYGFYEGGDSNPYRVAPSLLAAVLSGRASGVALVELQRRHAASIGALDQQKRALADELQRLLKFVAPSTAPDASLFDIDRLFTCRCDANNIEQASSNTHDECIDDDQHNDTANDDNNDDNNKPIGRYEFTSVQDDAARHWFETEIAKLTNEQRHLCKQHIQQLYKLKSVLL
jgi:hypothetical protein